MNVTTSNTEASIIQALRVLVPHRRLSFVESLGIAELQAYTFLHLAGLTEPPVPDELITELPRVHVELVTQMHSNVSAASKWVHGRWFVLLNARHPRTRRRFSLAHEFKHVLDHPFIDHLYPRVGELGSEARAEQVADHFAACLLEPRGWIKETWGRGVQDELALARRFDVSPAAMRVRLHELCLVEPRRAPRCGFEAERVAA